MARAFDGIDRKADAVGHLAERQSLCETQADNPQLIIGQLVERRVQLPGHLKAREDRLGRRLLPVVRVLAAVFEAELAQQFFSPQVSFVLAAPAREAPDDILANLP